MLAAGLPGLDCLSICLADFAAVPAGGNYLWGPFRILEGRPLSPCPIAFIETETMTRPINLEATLPLSLFFVE